MPKSWAMKLGILERAGKVHSQYQGPLVGVVWTETGASGKAGLLG